MNGIEKKGVAVKGILWLITTWISLPLFFLATGRSLDWWEAWVWCAIILIPMTIFGILVFRTDPEFLARRFKLREKDQSQRRVLAFGVPFSLAALVLPGLDHRFCWSEVPGPIEVTALALSLSAFLLILGVFVSNRWAGRTIETYDGQQVVSNGLYAVVRHPMYTGSLILWLATPVALGSWWALLPALAEIPLLVVRIRHEEDVLVRELKGYEEYRHRVRYRLVPLVW